jgi:hypothetical protein
VTPQTRIANFSVDQFALCVDEVGVILNGKCELLPDNETVRVTGDAVLCEWLSGSCGGNADECTSDHDISPNPADVPPSGSAVNLSISSFSDDDFSCIIPPNCPDEASFSNFTATNVPAPF